MIDSLITSKTRIKLLLRFFLNSRASGYLRGLEQEFGDSSNAIRLELNRFEEAGLLEASLEGNKKYYTANTDHPLYSDINNIIRKHIGLDQIVSNVIERLGQLEAVYLTGSFARGLDSSIIDILLIGDVDQSYLSQLMHKVEALISRRIRYIVYRENSAVTWSDIGADRLLLWQNGKTK